MHIYAEVPDNVLIPPLYDVFWSAVVLLIIGVTFAKVLPKVYAMLDERAEKIEGGLKHAENVQAEADALRAELESQLAEARKEAAHIREQAGDEVLGVPPGLLGAPEEEVRGLRRQPHAP